MGLLKDKNGIVTAGLFVTVGLILGVVIMLGVLLFTYVQISDALNQDVVVTTDGRTLADLNAVSFGVFSQGFVDNADYIGLGLIFGMIITLLMSAFFFRGKYPTLFIIVDIIIMLAVYIFATYIAYTYNILINSSSYLSFFVDNLPKSSTFVLYLNRFVGVIGTLIIIISYSMFPSDQQNPALRGDVYEGAY